MSGDVYAKVGAAIRAKRGDIGMTQSALADRTGLGRTSITNIESGTQSILLHQLLGIARAPSGGRSRVPGRGRGDGGGAHHPRERWLGPRPARPP